MYAYVGIDPGKSGGLACVNSDGDVVSAVPMPETERDILDWLRRQFGMSTKAVLEHVWSSPQMGVSSAFTFGKGFGGLRMALIATEIPFDEVRPTVWQTAMHCRTGGRIGVTVADKNITKRRAQELFPGVKVTHAISDALLIAEYCRRLKEGQLGKTA